MSASRYCECITERVIAVRFDVRAEKRLKVAGKAAFLGASPEPTGSFDAEARRAPRRRLGRDVHFLQLHGIAPRALVAVVNVVF